MPIWKAPSPRFVLLHGITAAAEMYRDYPIPVILVSAYHNPELIARAEADHIMAYLIKPIKQADLEPAIALAMRRFDHFQQLQKEANDLRQALADRKVIERAKGIIMKRAQLDEQEAFRRLQKLASEKNKKLIDLATMIVTAEEALGQDHSCSESAPASTLRDIAATPV